METSGDRTRRREWDPSDRIAFTTYLDSSTYIIALLGAGLSTASGLTTFRGPGSLWRQHDPRSLASPWAFKRDPTLVWLFYAHRRQLALRAAPNAGHVALAELARTKPELLTVTQNIDGLSQRAGHPTPNLVTFHRSLFEVRCFDKECDYQGTNSGENPIAPALATATPVDVADATIPLPRIQAEVLPRCPKCKSSLLRPAVVWYGETPAAGLDQVEKWFERVPRVDLVLIVGTAAGVYPANECIDEARERGARVAIFNTAPVEEQYACFGEGDWYFRGDAHVLLPDLLRAGTRDL